MKRILVAYFIFIIAGISFPLLNLSSQPYIADFSVAKEEVLRNIPEEYINKARNELVVAYQHTSHGTHVTYGIYGLPDYKLGDEVLFGVSTTAQSGMLEFRDLALQSYAPAGVDGSDLSRDEKAFIQTTRNYLDAPENAGVNVVMWSWCNIAGHNVAGNYLPGMDSLIAEYGPGGSKIGTGAGQRETPVTFIFMTGHANQNANVGTWNPESRGELITDHCNLHGYYCLDYYSIDTYDMDDNYWEDASDDGYSTAYGGNFYKDWQDSQVMGEGYYGNKSTPGGSVVFGAHNTQHITANRKGYAMWWILARIAGWDGIESTIGNRVYPQEITLFPNPGNGRFYVSDIGPEVNSIKVVRSDGTEVCTIAVSVQESLICIDIAEYGPGIYILHLVNDDQILGKSTIVITR